MGICSSSNPLEKQASDENIVYIIGDEGLLPHDDGQHDCKRRLASLYSQQGKKGPNQDSAILCQGFGMEEGVFCGVFDGHGRNGHIVSRLARDYLPSLLLNQRNALFVADDSYTFTDIDEFSSVDSENSPSSSPEMFDEWKDACVSAFTAMEKELELNLDLDFSYSGSTAVTIIKQGTDLIISNLGDSRAIMGTVSEEGQLKAIQLTTDLKPNIPQEAERIRKSNGRIFALKDEPNTQRVWLPNENYPGLAMARSFGDFQLKRYGVIAIPQVSYRQLTSRDQFIVLATDGVWDVLSNEQVVSIVWLARSQEEASKEVVKAAVCAWRRRYPTSKVDDCSAVCLFLQERREEIVLKTVKSNRRAT